MSIPSQRLPRQFPLLIAPVPSHYADKEGK